MKLDSENSKNLERTYENSEYYQLAIFRLMFRTGVFTSGTIFLIVLIIQNDFDFLIFIFLIAILCFSIFVILYKTTYKDLILKTPKKLHLKDNMLYIETLGRTYKINLEKVKMLGSGPYWVIEMINGIQYEFVVHHTITDSILKIWKDKYKGGIK